MKVRKRVTSWCFIIAELLIKVERTKLYQYMWVTIKELSRCVTNYRHVFGQVFKYDHYSIRNLTSIIWKKSVGPLKTKLVQIRFTKI